MTTPTYDDRNALPKDIPVVKSSISHDLKMTQDVLVIFAGREVSQSKCVASTDRNQKMLLFFWRHSLSASERNDKYEVEQFMTVSNGKAFTGKKLWARFLRVKKNVINTFLPAWNRLCPGGLLPSGKTMDDMLNELLAHLWKVKCLSKKGGDNDSKDDDEEEEDGDDAAARDDGAAASGDATGEESDREAADWPAWTNDNPWRPMEWKAWLRFGPAYEDEQERWSEFCQPPSGGEDGNVQATGSSSHGRKKQRVIEQVNNADTSSADASFVIPGIDGLIESGHEDRIVEASKLALTARKDRISELQLLIQLFSSDSELVAKCMSELKELLLTAQPALPKPHLTRVASTTRSTPSTPTSSATSSTSSTPSPVSSNTPGSDQVAQALARQ